MSYAPSCRHDNELKSSNSSRADTPAHSEFQALSVRLDRGSLTYTDEDISEVFGECVGKRGTLNMTNRGPNLGYLCIFGAPTPNTNMKGQILSHTNIDLLRKQRTLALTASERAPSHILDTRSSNEHSTSSPHEGIAELRQESKTINGDDVTDAIFPVFRSTVRNRHFGEDEMWRCLGWHRIDTVEYLEPNSEALVSMLAEKWNYKPRQQAGWEEGLRKKWAVITIKLVDDLVGENPMRSLKPKPKLGASEMLATLRLQDARRKEAKDKEAEQAQNRSELGELLTLEEHLSRRRELIDPGERGSTDDCSHWQEASMAKGHDRATRAIATGGLKAEGSNLMPATLVSESKEITRPRTNVTQHFFATDDHLKGRSTIAGSAQAFSTGGRHSAGGFSDAEPNGSAGAGLIYSKEDLEKVFGPLKSKLHDLNATGSDPNKLAFVLVIEPHEASKKNFDIVTSGDLQLIFLPPPPSTAELNPSMDASLQYSGRVLPDLVVPVFRAPPDMPRRGRNHGPWYYCGYYRVLSVRYPNLDDSDLLDALERKYSVELRNTAKGLKKRYAFVRIERIENMDSASAMQGIEPMTELALAEIIASYEAVSAANAERRSARMAARAHEDKEVLAWRRATADAVQTPYAPSNVTSDTADSYKCKPPHQDDNEEAWPAAATSSQQCSNRVERTVVQEPHRVPQMQSSIASEEIHAVRKTVQRYRQNVSSTKWDTTKHTENLALDGSTPMSDKSSGDQELAATQIPAIKKPAQQEEDLLEFEEWELAKVDGLNPHTIGQEEAEEAAIAAQDKAEKWPIGSLYNLPQIQHYHPRRFVHLNKGDEKI